MAITFNNIDRKYPLSNKLIIKKIINEIVSRETLKTGHINIIICSDDYLLKINKEYLNHDYYTDIITFNYNEGATINGDLFISLDMVENNSEKFKTSLELELSRVIFHGILHLCGYNDKNEKEKAIIRQEEDKNLERYMFHVKQN